MIPINLKISGFLSYQQPVELNFESFDLACISGANGAGKSSLLDAITWVLFGQARRKDDSIINSHCDSAEVVLDFSYEGNIYRVQRSKTTGKSVMLDFFIQDVNGKWKTLSERTMRDTETRIEQTLRLDYETFTNASFFLQGKADQFAQQRPGDRKRILGSILGLEIWETYREGAAGRRKTKEMSLAVLNSRLDEINSELQQEDERRALLKTLQSDLEQVVVLREAKEDSLDQLRKLATSLAEQQRLVDMLQEQLNASQRRHQDRELILMARQEERGIYQQQLDSANEIETAYTRWQQLRTELETWEKTAVNFRTHEARRTQPMMIIEAERSRLNQELKSLQEQQLQIKQLEDSLPALQNKRRLAKEEIEQTQEKLTLRSELEDELKELQATTADAAAENRRLKNEMSELKERILRLQETSGVTCPLCGQPLSSADRLRLIGELEDNGKQLGNRYRNNLEYFQKAENRSNTIEKILLDLKKLDPLLRQQHRSADQLDDQAAQIEKNLATWQAKSLPHLFTLQKRLEEEDFALDARRQLTELDAQLREIGYNSAQHEALKQAEQKLRSTEEQKRSLETARAALEPLQREISELQRALVDDKKEIHRQENVFRKAAEKYQQDAENLPDTHQAETDLYVLQEQENRIRMQVGGAVQAVEVLTTQKKKQKELEKQREQTLKHIAQLKTLERAFSKDGIPALLIEQALPEIETQANEILDRLTAGGMSVRFETQQEYKDKKREDRKETLDILISDAAGMRDYALFSGGEAFRVNFAIRLALSRVLAQRAGARLQSLVIDEGFGSQDSEGRQRLIEAINMVRSDFEKILVITHLEELKDVFPARIEVLKTAEGSRLKVIT